MKNMRMEKMKIKKVTLLGKGYLERNRGDWILTGVLFLVALLLTCLPIAKEVPMGMPAAVFGELTADRPLRQVLPVSGEAVGRIDLIFGTYNRSNTSEIGLYLVDESGKIYAETHISCGDLIDNVAYSWEFESVSFSKNQMISIEILSSGEAGDSVTLYYDPSQTGEIKVGDTVYQGQLAGTIYGGTEILTVFSYGISPLRAMVLLALVYVCLLCIARKEGMASVVRCMAVTTPCVLVLFCAMPPIITWDSAHYLNYLPILNGEVGFEEWDIVRGPVFPVILNLACTFFGKTSEGLLAFEFLFFEASLLCLLVVIQKFSIKKARLFPVLVVATLIFVFNPIFQGGYHAVLTEFPAAFLAILSCIVAWKWAKREGALNRTDAVYTAYFIVSSVLAWQLKQPYMGCTLYPLLAVLLHMVIVRRPWGKWRLQLRVAMPFACLLAMLLSSSIWTGFIASFGSMDMARTSSSLASGAILAGLPLKERGIYRGEDIQRVFELSASQAKSIEEGLPDDEYRVFQLQTVKGGLQPQIVMIPEDADGGIISRIGIFFRCLKEFPAESMENILLRYLKICNVLASSSEIPHAPSLHIQAGHGDENAAIYYRSAYGFSNVFYLSDKLWLAANAFYCQYTPSPLLRGVMLINAVLYADSMFKILMFLAPFVWAYFLFRIFRSRKSLCRMDELFFHFVLWTYCLCNLVFNVLFAAPIDRYLFTSFFVAFVSLAILISKYWVDGIQGIAKHEDEQKP